MKRKFNPNFTRGPRRGSVGDNLLQISQKQYGFFYLAMSEFQPSGEGKMV